jgi:hypothetical protein
MPILRERLAATNVITLTASCDCPAQSTCRTPRSARLAAFPCLPASSMRRSTGRDNIRSAISRIQTPRIRLLSFYIPRVIEPVELDQLPASISFATVELIKRGDDPSAPIGSEDAHFPSRREVVWRVACDLARAECSADVVVRFSSTLRTAYRSRFWRRGDRTSVRFVRQSKRSASSARLGPRDCQESCVRGHRRADGGRAPAIKKDTLDQLLEGRDRQGVFSKDGLLDELKKALAERALNADLEDHLERKATEGRANRRNG